jgi:hypothetical protein
MSEPSAAVRPSWVERMLKEYLAGTGLPETEDAALHDEIGMIVARNCAGLDARKCGRLAADCFRLALRGRRQLVAELDAFKRPAPAAITQAMATATHHEGHEGHEEGLAARESGGQA